jgi:hypothetical protein
MTTAPFTTDRAAEVAAGLGVDFGAEEFDEKQFAAGMNVELEHGSADPATNVTNDDPTITGKIALAHLREFPDYYIRLAKMEAEAEGKPAPTE